MIQIFLVNQLQIGPKPISHLSSFCKFLPFRKQQLLAKYPGSCCIYTKTLGNLAVPKGNSASGIAKSSKIYNFGGLISLRPKCRSRPAMKEWCLPWSRTFAAIVGIAIGELEGGNGEKKCCWVLICSWLEAYGGFLHWISLAWAKVAPGITGINRRLAAWELVLSSGLDLFGRATASPQISPSK